MSHVCHMPFLQWPHISARQTEWASVGTLACLLVLLHVHCCPTMRRQLHVRAVCQDVGPYTSGLSAAGKVDVKHAVVWVMQQLVLRVKQQPIVLCSCMQHGLDHTHHVHLTLSLQQAHIIHQRTDQITNNI